MEFMISSGSYILCVVFINKSNDKSLKLWEEFEDTFDYPNQQPYGIGIKLSKEFVTKDFQTPTVEPCDCQLQGDVEDKNKTNMSGIVLLLLF